MFVMEIRIPVLGEFGFKDAGNTGQAAFETHAEIAFLGGARGIGKPGLLEGNAGTPGSD